MSIPYSNEWARLQSALENVDVPTRLQTALKIEAVAEPTSKGKRLDI